MSFSKAHSLSVARITLVIKLTGILLISGCASLRQGLGLETFEKIKPISNPFGGYRSNGKGDSTPLILRSKKGDRSVEVEVPGNSSELSEFVLPMGNAFKDSAGRDPASAGVFSNEGNNSNTDETYKTRTASPTDREITGSFSHGSPEDEGKKREIEQSLNLIPSEDNSSTEGTPSYLAAIDHVKQLYRTNRFEAALIETDDMLKLYQTDPRLYEMRGTLLDRLGRREFALKSWSQALKLNPKNAALKKFIDRKIASNRGGAS